MSFSVDDLSPEVQDAIRRDGFCLLLAHNPSASTDLRGRRRYPAAWLQVSVPETPCQADALRDFRAGGSYEDDQNAGPAGPWLQRR